MCQRNVQHSGYVSFLCPSSLIRAFARSIVLRSRRTRMSGFLLVVNICPAVIGLVCTISTHVSVALHMLRAPPRTGDEFPAAQHSSHAKIRCVLRHAPFQLLNSVTDFREVWRERYFTGDLSIFKFSDSVIAYYSTAGKCIRYEDRNVAMN